MPEVIELWANQAESFKVEMRHNPHTGIYRGAFMFLFAIFFGAFLARLRLEDTFIEEIGEFVGLAIGYGIAYLAARLIHVPVIRIDHPDSQSRMAPPAASSPITALPWKALVDRLQQEMRQQGHELSDDEADDLARSGENLPGPMKELFTRLNESASEYEPGV